MEIIIAISHAERYTSCWPKYARKYHTREPLLGAALVLNFSRHLFPADRARDCYWSSWEHCRQGFMVVFVDDNCWLRLLLWHAHNHWGRHTHHHRLGLHHHWLGLHHHWRALHHWLRRHHHWLSVHFRIFKSYN